MFPIYNNNTPNIENQVYNENLLVYLDTINTNSAIERFGTESIIKQITCNIKDEKFTLLVIKGQFGSYRNILVNNKNENVAVIHYVTNCNICCIANIYTRPDYRNKGLFTRILKEIKQTQTEIYISRNLSISGASVFNIIEDKFIYK
jgi:predicted GNAT family acetyltransferase